MHESLPVEQLRWRCDPDSLGFETTADVEPTTGVVGQTSAVDALRFGLECDAPGQNVFVRGLHGTGRMTLVGRLLDELRPSCRSKYDRCYVHRFSDPDRPRLITLPPGKARVFRRAVSELVDFIRDSLGEALEAEPVRARRQALVQREESQVRELMHPFEEALAAAGLALVSVQIGEIVQPTIYPVIDGNPVPPEEFENQRRKGKISDEQFKAYETGRTRFLEQLEEIASKIRVIHRKSAEEIRRIYEETVRLLLSEFGHSILELVPSKEIEKFLEELIDDVVERGPPVKGKNRLRYYEVNIVQEHDSTSDCPIVIENTPSLTNLLGSIEREWGPAGPMPSDYRMIRGGSILRADGGYLVLDARDLISEPGAWRVLVRTLRSGKLEIVPPEFRGLGWQPTLKPEPIPVKVRVILLGDSQIYYLLDGVDPDFGHLFKVLSDFETVIPRDADGLRGYAGVLARIGKDESLHPFDKNAVAALAEHGARIASMKGKLTARFARIADIAREASFLAGKDHRNVVTGDDVLETVRRTRCRGDLPSRRFQELIREGTIRIQTSGVEIGQINGLAVMSAGPLTYGFPARITATIGAGNAGIIDIEGRSSLSGSIHTKGFHILGGLLRHLLRAEHALAFSASLAFEQSYGGIDGDSASGAEICCLLSALTAIPIHQGIAMTGAIDQHGHIQAIGGVNEKIEGFFDACCGQGLDGNQGVVIPTSNSGELMLRHDVVAACAEGRFHIWAVPHVTDALEVLTGVEAGKPDEDGLYPEGTLLRIAVEKAQDYWARTLQTPHYVYEEADEEQAEGSEGPQPPGVPPPAPPSVPPPAQ